ncbi:hypothetical protein FBZ81_103250 [Azospirillum brasilense]|nr:hypothetical protein OH82_00437 [Azospirillum brasilense]TWB84982.1 hypothetical protein FBZ81_103250 [Azospirillum brasilense]
METDGGLFVHSAAGYAVRTGTGRPASSMRLRADTPIMASAC